MGHHNCCNKQNVKRGLWSPEEDEKLMNYITAFGHGCWSTVPRLAGLQRCGKSCRLRWINYLRPDLKRGNFTPQEAALIIELHRILGNKWAQIAKHLPGRTDNEVKNFWNSSIKKKLIAHHKKSDQNSNLIINNQNNNLTEMDIQMITNSQMEKIPTQPPMPPRPPFHGYTDHTCSIEPGFNQVMNYSPNAVTAAAAPPIPISVDSSLFDLPSWNNQVLKQEDDFMFGSFDENPILDNSFINLKPQMQAYDYDSAMLDALMPELSEMNKMIDQFAPPLPPPPVAAVPSAMKGQQILHDPIGGSLDDGCFVPLHPNHINNIASLMASFAPPPPPSRAAFPPPPPPCNHPFRFTRYLPVSHDRM